MIHHIEHHLPAYGAHLGRLYHHGGGPTAAQEHVATILMLGQHSPEAALHLHQRVIQHLAHGGYHAEAAALHQATHQAVSAASQMAAQQLAQQPMQMQANQAPTTGLPQGGAPGQRSA